MGRCLKKIEYLEILRNIDAAIGNYAGTSDSNIREAQFLLRQITDTREVMNFIANVLTPEGQNLSNQANEAGDADQLVVNDLLNLISNGTYSIAKKHFEELSKKYQELEEDADYDYSNINALNREIEFGKDPEDDEEMREKIAALRQDIKNDQEEMEDIQDEEKLFREQLQNWENELNNFP